MRVFFDTNVLAHQYDDSAGDKQRIAREVFLSRAEDAVISTQVMIELHAVLTRRLGVSREAAARVLDTLALEVVPADEHLVRRAADTAAAHQLSIFDALVLEAAAAAGCHELWTEDLADGSILRGVRIVNPFRAD
ncbi:MAG TPA: PIN domain-containing protein [Gordonia sp. (in: high G+C Gram-positive bacteria)]|uniref:PIN domain-containing protein n=1 Tax=unclassified Gordonia (in: high G+C Gram-positive bacteria) TaxID=2657482 RepID=UPI000FBFAD16|nr:MULTISPECIES: PIN domain-containing protein [unclassified Gordonia (in: high G+C Gram-positive bacteria)]RUP41239.1 MAG: PIN domain-containing protein [Gordonia sp. (in: high G+C Gram-positive bacteria)]HNP55561.1 PIN domain-containing protein [Gordonia sp. (in: high G+C Gram-positive bacteria)]HRC51031.1 PIN domain-containing protein [Gordonia sp. (in: high G+C Gram-positive bacteria)]